MVLARKRDKAILGQRLYSVLISGAIRSFAHLEGKAGRAQRGETFAEKQFQ